MKFGPVSVGKAPFVPVTATAPSVSWEIWTIDCQLVHDMFVYFSFFV